MKKFQYIVVLLFVIVLGTGCSNDEKQENFLSETENEIENKEDNKKEEKKEVILSQEDFNIAKNNVKTFLDEFLKDREVSE